MIDIEIGDAASNFLDKQVDLSSKVEKVLNTNCTVKALSLEGTINALQTKFKAQISIAQTQVVRAMIFKDLVIGSPT